MLKCVHKLTQRISQALVGYSTTGGSTFAKTFAIQKIIAVYSQTYQAYRCIQYSGLDQRTVIVASHQRSNDFL